VKRFLSVLLGLIVMWLSLVIIPTQVQQTINPGSQNPDIVPNTDRPTPQTIGGLWEVAGVIDGDTIEVWNGEVKQKVRYIGIDAPESYPEPSECFAEEATVYNSSLVAGTWVDLQHDTSNTDQYGRWLRYVYVGKTFVNEDLVRNGYATAKMYPPDTEKSNELVTAERTAKAESSGLWGCTD
jgi:micrococcal nuclease